MMQTKTIIEHIVKDSGKSRESLMPILQEVIKQKNYISEKDILDIAEGLDLSPAEIYGTATFYSFLDTKKRGMYVIRLCKSIIAVMKGKDEIEKVITKILHIKPGESTQDNMFTFLETNDIGWSDKEPSMLINEDLFIELTPEKTTEIIKAYISGDEKLIDSFQTKSIISDKSCSNSNQSKCGELKGFVKKADMIFNKDCDSLQKLSAAIKIDKDNFISELIESGLRGRGGAGFPTGLKWKFAKSAQSEEKYVICNADEGEPGTFKDRVILQEVPCKVFAGMALCGHIVGAKKGFLYLRGEYIWMANDLKAKLEESNQMFIDLGLDFNIEIRMGSGAYVCGEETALIESMEGKRGEPRNKPPYPASAGFRDKPTVINNVETFIFALEIANIGAQHFKTMGTSDSAGSKLFSISGDTPKPGVYELELGMTLADFVEEFGDGDTKAVQVGGASGFCVPRRKFKDTIIGFEGIPTGGSMMLFNSHRSMYNVLHNYLEFFSEESCGQCTPCRVGCQQLFNGVEAIKSREKSENYLDDLLELSETMKIASKCGLGQSVANSFKSIVREFKEEIVY
ncbi:MAG: NAD(P)H-dependent oxidoreductase subunit E [Bacteroidales bacterium]|nr:NAD(P)H-dependent oxidoreductase subunit E [Bacteroidales bacterium]